MERLNETRRRGKTVTAWAVSAGLLLYFSVVFYQGRDEDGWIMHDANVDMLMSPEWLDGESRDCVAQMNPNNGAYLVRGLRCPAWTRATEKHTIPVAFWGQVERTKPNVTYYPDDGWHGATDWRCVRKGNSFTCYAMD